MPSAQLRGGRATARVVLLWLSCAAAFFSPLVLGIFGVFPYAFVAAGLLVFTTYALRSPRSRWIMRLALVLAAASFTLTVAELIARPVLFYRFDFRPANRYLYRWPPLPLLQRYAASVNVEGIVYGDMAALSGRREWREPRRVRFVTDAYGFRNEPSVTAPGAPPLDMIVLGDSFGAAAATSQERTLAGVLARDYGLRVYNLSIPRENPRQQYANMVLEGPRLSTRPGATVLWLIFTGNDLDEAYHGELEHPRPAWPSSWTRLGDAVRDLGARSALRRLLAGGPSPVIERTFVDGRRVLFFITYAQVRNRTADDVRRHPNLEGLKATLGAMQRLTAERRLRVAVALVPSKEEVYAWMLDAAPPWSTDPGPSGFSIVLRDLAAQRGFAFLDLKPALVAASRRVYETSGALLWWPDDSHWNDEGQRVAAVAVSERLLRR
jgi:hypothetical protein